MNIVILDDYQDAVRKLDCAAKLEAYQAKVYTNTVKGLGQLSVRLKDADVIVLNRERTHITRQLVEKLPKLKLIVQTGRVGPHIDISACSGRGINLGADHGRHAPPAPLHWQPQTRRMAAIWFEVGLHASELRLGYCPQRCHPRYLGLRKDWPIGGRL